MSDAGPLTASFRYRSYGGVAQSFGAASPTTLGYNGQLRDPSGLLYLRARWYDPATGRFLSRDPLRGDPSAPATLNAFGYAGANPMLMSDPSGLAFSDGDEDGGSSESVPPTEASGVSPCLPCVPAAAVLIPAAAQAAPRIGSSTLAAFSAAAATASAAMAQWTPKAYHLAGGPGSQNKFAGGLEEARTLVDLALSASATSILPNFVKGIYTPDRAVFLYDTQRLIGTKREEVVKVVVDIAGRIVTAYPIRR